MDKYIQVFRVSARFVLFKFWLIIVKKSLFYLVNKITDKFIVARLNLWYTNSVNFLLNLDKLKMFTALKNKVVYLVSGLRQALLSKLGGRQAAVILVAFLLISGGVFFLAKPVMAGVFAKAIASIISIYVSIIGKLILLLFDITVGWLFPYNDFLSSQAVVTGWVLTRDIANMFFILILLAIAFGTILKIEQLNYQKILPKLLIMAVLINFSKTICGVIIDFGQVIMLTFVNAFLAAAGGNFLNAMGIFRLMQIAENSSELISDDAVVNAFGFAAIMVTVALIVVVVYVAVLAYRIVILWILIILAPIAWLAGAFPIGKASQVYSQWWENFVGAVIIGPVLAFFLWLALLTAGSGTLGAQFENDAYTRPEAEEAITGGLSTAAGQSFFLNEGGTSEATTGFIIATVLMLAGLAAAQQSGGAAGAFAGKMSGGTKGFVGGALKRTAVGTGALGVKAARRTAGAADRQFRIREGLYKGMGAIPGLKQTGLRNLAKVRSERAKEISDDYNTVKSLSPAEIQNLLRSPARTAKDKNLKMLANRQALTSGHASYLKEQGWSPQAIKNFQASNLKQLQTSAKDIGHVELMKEANEYADKNPQLIQDAEKRKEAYRNASPEDMKKWSSEAWKDTVGLEAMAEKEREAPGSVSSMVDKIGGNPKALFNRFREEYKPGSYPGEGRFTLEEGFEPAQRSAGEELREKARTDQVQKLSVNKLELMDQPDALDNSGAFNEQIRNIQEEQMLGGADAATAFNYNVNTGKFNMDPSQLSAPNAQSFRRVMEDARKGAVAAAPEERTKAADVVANIDVRAVRKEGEYRDAVLGEMDDQALAKAYQNVGADQKAEVEKVISAVSDALKDKINKLDPGTDAHSEAMDKYRKMKANQAISRHVS